MFFVSISFIWVIFLKWIKGKSKTAAYLLAAGFVCLHLHDNFQFLKFNSSIEKIRTIDPLIKILKEKNLTHVYAHYITSRVLTFESKGEIICADFFGFYDFKNPFQQFEPILPLNWKAYSNVHLQIVTAVFDRNQDTKWHTRSRKKRCLL